MRCMEDSAVGKQKATLSACLEVTALAATKHANGNGCLDVTAAALFRLVSEHDHGPELATSAAALASGDHNSNVLVGAALMKGSVASRPITW